MGGGRDRNRRLRDRTRAALARTLLLLGVAALLGACAGPVPVPVTERSAKPAHAGTYTVRRGDTLYSIAWGAGLDYRALARWNQIPPPYVIHPGQRLRLRPPAHAVPAVADRPEALPAPPRRAATPAPVPAPPRAPPASKAPTSGTAKAPGWVWPTAGRVLRGFSVEHGRKGIEISGRSGQPVRSAAAGRVVYAGSGLRGYGKLIIVKHDETFLSAYAHNRKLLVQEGHNVARGQTIAEMGSTGTSRTKLHFEIRRRGVPVDPLRYLPKR